MATIDEIIKRKPNRVSIGLKDFTNAEIQWAVAKFEGAGYAVKHKTKNLPANGVLQCQLKEVKK